MGKREKLIERLTNNPQNATFADIRNLLESEGFYLDVVTEHYHIFIYSETIFAIPVHSNRAKGIYVKKILELIERADSHLEEED
jgi:hypothetical protein